MVLIIFPFEAMPQPNRKATSQPRVFLPSRTLPCEVDKKAGLEVRQHDTILRPVFTQKMIGLDYFASCIIHIAGPKKVDSLLSGLQITGSNWNMNRKLVPKAHARVQFCSDQVRPHAYFPELKLAFNRMCDSHLWRMKITADVLIPHQFS